uniref:Protein kinase domain-containing protein n=2 Tax=Aegilops tauschii subsp. strangulata TaxID=200361 RepID=A0A453RJ29_AEGTS
NRRSVERTTGGRSGVRRCWPELMDPKAAARRRKANSGRFLAGVDTAAPSSAGRAGRRRGQASGTDVVFIPLAKQRPGPPPRGGQQHRQRLCHLLPTGPRKGPAFSVPLEQGLLRHWLLQCCHPQRLHLLQHPVLLDWVISNSTCGKELLGTPTSGCRSSSSSCQNYTSFAYKGYRCRCSAGYQGNPYVVDGCQDIDECAHWELHSCYGTCINMPGAFRCQCPDETYGNPFMKGGCIKNKKSSQGLSIGLVASGGSILVLLAFGAPFVTRKIKQQKAKKRKDKFFKQNHGLLFQQLVSQRADMGERMIITLAELEKATNNFDKTREVGGGGHGIVYKGILDLQVVAIKKSKIIVQREIDDFINEVAILSQINHRNVVKLIGCCLEAEVPLLVYEFISNGTLEHHLHVEGSVSLSWNDRLRIALEISTALAYLHSAASIPVYHRDIKSANILLDESLTAKVSDFGASKFIPIDQTGVTTAVQGTIGYLDPMYYYTGRLTDKSDVFSFGVLLVELLTRKRPLAYDSVDGDSLVLHFASLVTGSVLADLLDPQVMEEEDGEVQEVAALAAKCVRLNGEDRPAMREVEMTLENLRIKRKQAARDAKSRRYDDDGQFSIDDTATEGDTEEPSGEYTVEERILLSERYPR